MNTDSGRPCPTNRGTSIFVGTADGNGVPACCRAIALSSSDELKTATVYVPMSTSRDVIANIAATRRVAVVSSYPLDHLTTQLKGTTTNVRLAHDDELELLRDRIDGLADVLHLIGMPRRIVRSITHWPAFAVEMKVEEIYEQTPGPKAGVTLR